MRSVFANSIADLKGLSTRLYLTSQPLGVAQTTQSSGIMIGGDTWRLRQIQVIELNEFGRQGRRSVIEVA